MAHSSLSCPIRSRCPPDRSHGRAVAEPHYPFVLAYPVGGLGFVPQTSDRLADDLQIPLNTLAQQAFSSVVLEVFPSVTRKNEEQASAIRAGAPRRPSGRIKGTRSPRCPWQSPGLRESTLRDQVHVAAEEVLQVFFEAEIPVEKIRGIPLLEGHDEVQVAGFGSKPSPAAEPKRSSCFTPYFSQSAATSVLLSSTMPIISEY